MIIDCDTCEVRGRDCADCVVTFMTIPVRDASAPGRVVDLHPDVGAAVHALSAGGLVPPLRHVDHAADSA